MGSAYPQPGLYRKSFDVDMDPLVEVVQDTVGRHDSFALACTAKYYEDLGYPGHVNCSQNFNGAGDALRRRAAQGLGGAQLLLQHRLRPQQRLHRRRALVAAGDYVLLRAADDLLCASSACPDDIDPANGWEITDVHVRVYRPENRFSLAIAHRVTPEAEPVMTQETAFHPRTSALTRDLVEYRGYWLPDCYEGEGTIAEYWACREAAVVMDLSPLRKFEVLGPDAEMLMQRAVTRDVRKLSVGQVTYTAVCNETGGMLDDATVYRLGDDNFRFVVGDPYTGVHLTELAEAESMRAWVKPSTDQLHNLAVQGPSSREILKEIVWTPPTQPALEELRWFRLLIGRIGGHDGIPIVVSRTGYTGELGYEVWCHPDDGPAVWDAVWEAGAEHGLKPLGLSALDMLRIESGLIFAGYEFDDQVDPFEAGIGFAVALDSEDDFVGKDRPGGAQGPPPAQARRPRAGRAGDRRPRRLRPRAGRPRLGRGDHQRHPQPGPAQEHRAVPDRRPARRARHRGRGRQARRPAEADPGDGGADPLLRPEEEQRPAPRPRAGAARTAQAIGVSGRGTGRRGRAAAGRPRRGRRTRPGRGTASGRLPSRSGRPWRRTAPPSPRPAASRGRSRSSARARPRRARPAKRSESARWSAARTLTAKRWPSCSSEHIFVRRSIEIRISGGSIETDMKAFAVIPWIWSPARVVITVTPVANMPSVRRSATAGSSPSISSCSGSGTATGASPIPSGPLPTQAPASASVRSNSCGRLTHSRIIAPAPGRTQGPLGSSGRCCVRPGRAAARPGPRRRGRRRRRRWCR